MATLTSAEAQTIWDNRASACGVSKKKYSSDTKDAGTFVTYIFTSDLAGVLYHINSADDGVNITHSSSAATVETNIKAYLETLEKIVEPTLGETTI